MLQLILEGNNLGFKYKIYKYDGLNLFCGKIYDRNYPYKLVDIQMADELESLEFLINKYTDCAYEEYH